MSAHAKRKITLKDVAREAGVSPQLVSGVFSGKPSTIRCGEETRVRVLAIAEKLGFRPDIRARGLRAGRSFLVGVMVHAHSHWLQSDLLRGIQRNLEADDITPLLLTHATPEEEEKHLGLMLDRHVDAVLVNTSGGPTLSDRYAGLAHGGLPVVQLIDNSLSDAGIPYVIEDMHASGYMAARRLIETGRRNIALLTHERHTLNRDAIEHREGYERALAEAGLKPRVIAHSLKHFVYGETHSWYDCVGEVADAIFDARHRPDGIVCYTSAHAFRVAELAAERGVSIGRDMGLVGHHDMPICRISRPPLTSLCPDYLAMGDAAANIVRELMDGKKPESRRIAPTLVVRASA